MHVQRNELRSTISVDMHPRDFDEMMRPIETIRPLVTHDRTQVIGKRADGMATYRPASPDESENGELFTQELFAALPHRITKERQHEKATCGQRHTARPPQQRDGAEAEPATCRQWSAPWHFA